MRWKFLLISKWKYTLVDQFWCNVFQMMQLSSDVHSKRLEMVSWRTCWFILMYILTRWSTESIHFIRIMSQIRALMEPSQSETITNDPREMIRQGLGNPVGVNTHMKSSASSEQLLMPSGSQMLQQLTRYWRIGVPGCNLVFMLSGYDGVEAMVSILSLQEMNWLPFLVINDFLHCEC